MANPERVERDERTEFVERASYVLGYRLLAYALLLDVIYRSLRLGEAAWDLLGLVIVSGAVLALYQYRHRILGRRWLRMAALPIGIAMVLAFLLAALLRQ